MTRPRRLRSDSVQSPLETYLREINETPLLSAEEEKQLAYRIQEGDSSARDHMVRANLRLVVNIARSYAAKGLTLPDHEHALQYLRGLLDSAVDEAGGHQHGQDDPHPRVHGAALDRVAPRLGQ